MERKYLQEWAQSLLRENRRAGPSFLGIWTPVPGGSQPSAGSFPPSQQSGRIQTTRHMNQVIESKRPLATPKAWGLAISLRASIPSGQGETERQGVF